MEYETKKQNDFQKSMVSESEYLQKLKQDLDKEK